MSVMRAFAIATAASCAGCLSFTAIGRARTVPRKHWELYAAPEVRATATLEGDANVRPAGEIGARYGASDRVDLGLRVGEWGASATTRVQILRSHSRRSGVDVLLAPGLAYQLTDKAAIELPVLVGFNLRGEHQIVLAPRAVYQLRFGLDHPAQFVFLGGSAAFVWQATRHVALVPEIAVLESIYAEPGFTSFTQAGPALQGAVGILWDP